MKKDNAHKTAHLLLGSNLGNRTENLAEMIEQLSKIGKVRAKSKIYVSEPWGFEAVENFFNQAVELETALSPHQLLTHCLEIEILLGRNRKQTDRAEGYQSRTADVDILLWEDLVIESEQLTIPHPRLHERRFALLPLAEIAGNEIHPTLNKTVITLLEGCSDVGKVWQLCP